MKVPSIFFIFVIYFTSTSNNGVFINTMNSSFQLNNQEKVGTFNPSDYKGQTKKLRKPKRFGWFELALILIALGVIGGLLWLTFSLIGGVRAALWRILIGVLGIGLSAGVAFLALLLYSYTYPSERDMKFEAHDKASNRLIKLAKQLDINWLKIIAIQDENFRIGMIMSHEDMIIIDYLTDQGWRIPEAEVINIITNEDSDNNIQKPVHQIITNEAKENSAAQQLIFVLKNENPFQIHFTDTFYNIENFAAECKMAWQMQ